MKCKSCGFENEFTEKYCFICGRALYNHLFSTDYNNDSKTEPAGQDKPRDFFTPLHETKPEVDRDFMNRLGPIGGDIQSSIPESQEQPPDPVNPLPPKLEPNNTFYFTNSTPLPGENQTVTEESETSERSTVTPSDPLYTGNDGLSAAGQGPAPPIVSAIPSEDSVSLRFSLDRLIHGNIRPTVQEEESLQEPADTVVDMSTVSVDSTGAPDDISVISDVQEDKNGISESNFREAEEPEIEPVSDQEPPLDIHSLELSSIHSLSSLEYELDHKSLSYGNSGLMDERQDEVTEQAQDESLETELPSAVQPVEDIIQPVFGDGGPTLGILQTEAVEEQKIEDSENVAGSGVNAEECVEMASETEEPGLSQPALPAEPLPEQPQLDVQPAKPVFHLNGFVISDETTFVRPLSKSAFSSAEESGSDKAEPNGAPDPQESLTNATNQTDILGKPSFGGLISPTESGLAEVAGGTVISVDSDSFEETISRDDTSIEASDSIGAEIEDEFPEEVPIETAMAESDDFSESGVIPGRVDNIPDETILATSETLEPGAAVSPNPVQSQESVEDLALIDYSQEVTERYAETFAVETDYLVDALQTREETREEADGSSSSEVFENTGSEYSIITDTLPMRPISGDTAVHEDKSLEFDDSDSLTQTESVEETDDPNDISSDKFYTAETGEPVLHSGISGSAQSEPSNQEESPVPLTEPIQSTIEFDIPHESQPENEWISNADTGFGIHENKDRQTIDEPVVEVVHTSTDIPSGYDIANDAVEPIEPVEQVTQAAFTNTSPFAQNTVEASSEPMELDGWDSQESNNLDGRNDNESFSEVETGIDIPENNPQPASDDTVIAVFRESTDVSIGSNVEIEAEVPADQAVFTHESVMAPNPDETIDAIEPVDTSSIGMEAEITVESTAPTPGVTQEPSGILPDENLIDSILNDAFPVKNRVEIADEPSLTTDENAFLSDQTETGQPEGVAGGVSSTASSGGMEEAEELKHLIPANFLNESPAAQNITVEDSSQQLPSSKDPVSQPETVAVAENEVAGTAEFDVEPEIVFIPEGGTTEQVYKEHDDSDDLSVTEFNWLWKRCGATFADGALLGLPLGLLLSFLKADGVAFIFLFVIIYWIYSTMFEASALQATPGKLLFGLIVADHNGNRLSYLQANNRFFAKILSGVLLRVITEKKQCLHDVLSDTLVLGG